MDRDEFFMMEAIKQAKKALEQDEVPIGAVLVLNDKVIAKGFNQVEFLKDATAHAEMLCLSAGFNYFNDWRLQDTILYCTLEPCIMCAGAIINARVKKLVWAAPDIRVGANGSLVDIFEKNHPIHNIEIKKEVLKEACSQLLKEFFQKKRSQKKTNFF